MLKVFFLVVRWTTIEERLGQNPRGEPTKPVERKKNFIPKEICPNKKRDSHQEKLSWEDIGELTSLYVQ